MRLPVSSLLQPWRAAAHPRAGGREGPMAWLAWLVLALALVPALGRVHQTLHTGGHNVALSGGVEHARHAAGPAHRGEGALGAFATSETLEFLLPTHTSGIDCLLLDQLALADGLLAPALGLPATPCTHYAPVGFVQHVVVLHRALFQARAPPVALRA